jgi:hypothetical protein
VVSLARERVQIFHSGFTDGLAAGGAVSNVIIYTPTIKIDSV